MSAKHKVKDKRSLIKKLLFILALLTALLILNYSIGLNEIFKKIVDFQFNNGNISSKSIVEFTETKEPLAIPSILQGSAGPKGDKGEPGEQGPAGKKGKSGKIGVTGPAGASGLQGATGPQGPVGPAGPTGATGPQGEKGDPGVTTFGYRGSFFDTSTQQHISINSAKAMELNSTSSAETNGVSISNNDLGRPTRITVANKGTYNLQFSAQLARTTGHKGTVNAEIWLRKMNSNVDMSNTKITLTGDEDSAKTVASWNFLVYLEANQYVELMWAVDDLRMEMPTITTGLNGPSIPSLIATMTQVG